eukprot:Nitzschia sp. Nitz4//scaffold28_size193895//23413//24537//NITZ4_001626-RA/size193895-processed-gene-0.6-mRNA-1//1//CDS//3329545865//6137//frame0
MMQCRIANLLTNILIALLLCNFIQPCLSSVYSSRNPCEQKNQPLVILARNPITEEFTVVQRFPDGNEIDLGLYSARKLSIADIPSVIGGVRSQILPGIKSNDIGDAASTNRMLDQTADDVFSLATNTTSTELYYAWECGCFQTVGYCPLDIQTCLRPHFTNPDGTPGCMNVVSNVSAKRNVFIIVIIWFSSLVVCLVCGQLGKSCCNHILSRAFPSWTDRVADRMMEREPDRVNKMLRLYLVRQQREYERTLEQRRREESPGNPEEANPQPQGTTDQQSEESTSKPTALALRTTKYRRPAAISSMECDDEQNDDHICTICLGTLEDGDRVGSLEKCNHIFHAECLKHWLQRRNACPLCKMEMQLLIPPHLSNNS